MKFVVIILIVVVLLILDSKRVEKRNKENAIPTL